ncbi:hypothetical protein M758_1G080800 [Ceratodon purpureus]|uniref:Uncharacterized protein n=1 Tax=Ceratodon purpureus TaxID=3225 RepID=A0A8T0J615_CERPU|nr:hypothetical protein KC19_1G082400 [Ceratodon purpureus]KAG0590223.1 hypothetical protein KC19_1G082400 [Ceratodon purpureus]KAG0629153.1 hypothetical protein M758_1G080800 [Ceratodon purpureus]
MTAVLHSQRNVRHFSSDSDEYNSTLQYLTDSDTEGYSGNHASPLVDEDIGSLKISPRLSASTSLPKYRSTKVHEAGAQLSMVALVLATVRKSLLTCQAPEEVDVVGGERTRATVDRVKEKGKAKEVKMSMDIGWPTDVEHVAHVTFDRYNGFLGLPEEYEHEVPRPTPSASKNVFGVSVESMQCSQDSQGNMVPTILLLLQKQLYDQNGLKAEGIFRINPENSHEEHVREQLNKGIVPPDIDIHALAGLIKAWFRELPTGVLDSLSPEQVLACHGEKDSLALIKQLPPTEAALLDWAINLMADVVELESLNKMNARNIAMVFAPNMTQMVDPLTALMHAVQVMNLLKTLILRTLKDRKASLLESHSPPSSPELPETEEPEHDPQAALWVEDVNDDVYGGSVFNRHDRQWSQTSQNSSAGLLRGHDRTSSQSSQSGVWMGHERGSSGRYPPLSFMGSHIDRQPSPIFGGPQKSNPFLKSSTEDSHDRNSPQSTLMNGQSRNGEEPQGDFSPFMLFPPTHSMKGKGASGRMTPSIDQRAERVEAW